MKKIAVLTLTFTFVLSACGDHESLADVIDRVSEVNEDVEPDPVSGDIQSATFDRYNLPTGGLHFASGNLVASDFDLSISGCRGGAVFQGMDESMLCQVNAASFEEITGDVSECQWNSGAFLSFDENAFVVSDRSGENFYALRFSQADKSDFATVLVQVKPLAVDLF